MKFLKSRSVLKEINQSKLDCIQLKGEILDKLHTIQLEMLGALLSLCNKHDIQILLGGGTFLGAIRHQGFIPWDDDIDLMMTRKQFNKLLVHFNELSTQYQLQYAQSIHPSYLPFAKIMKYHTTYEELGDQKVPKFQGVYIDIFIIENIPDHFLARKIYGIRSLFNHYVATSVAKYQFRCEEDKKMFSNSFNAKINYWIRMSIGFLFSYRSAKKWFEKLAAFDAKYANQNTTHMSIPSGRGHYFKEIQPSSVFNETDSYTFANYTCLGVKQKETYLRNLYGENYMQIPPENEREYHYIKRFEVGDNDA